MNPEPPRDAVRASIGEPETGSAGSNTAGATSQLKQNFADATARFKSVARDTADRAKEEAQGLASDAKQKTANRLGGYGSAVHESAKSLEQQDPNIAWVTHRVANRIQSVADYIRESDLDDLQRDAEDLARRHPIAFFGGLFVAGLIVGNILKARPTEPIGQQGELEMGDGSSTEGPLGASSAPEPGI